MVLIFHSFQPLHQHWEDVTSSTLSSVTYIIKFQIHFSVKNNAFGLNKDVGSE